MSSLDALYNESREILAGLDDLRAKAMRLREACPDGTPRSLTGQLTAAGVPFNQAIKSGLTAKTARETLIDLLGNAMNEVETYRDVVDDAINTIGSSRLPI